MTHQEKIDYMNIAASIVGYKFETKNIDMLISMYDLVLEKKGETDLLNIVRVQSEVEQREQERVAAKTVTQ